MSYNTEYQRSINDKESFWLEKAHMLPWFKKPNLALSQDEHAIHRWFADGEMNTSYMALDHHVVANRGAQAAIIYDSPVTNSKETITYKDLLNRVAKTAGMLKNHGVVKGDRVVIYMPMIPQAVIAMLACARLGAIHSVVFGGFAALELASRIDNATPKLILSASCGIEGNRIIEYKPLLDNALAIASHKPVATIIYQRKQQCCELRSGFDYLWQDEHQKAQTTDAVAVRGDDYLYILYTSGTTGQPKGVVREHGGHAVALHYSMESIYDIAPGQVFWAASDVGWVVGHSYIVYAPLLRGATSVLFEGKPIGTPDAGAFWRVISEHQVQALFTAPTAFRAIKKEDQAGEHIKRYDMSCLKRIFSAGERLDPPTFHWLEEHLGVPIIDNWWQTETGWPIAANPTGIDEQPVKAGSATYPSFGFDIHILDDQGNELGANEQGNIALKLPLPPSCLTSVWGSVERFKTGYLSDFPGYYNSGNCGYFDENGYLFVMGRTDDVINVAGHRFSTGEMEAVVGKHQAVAECAVMGRNDDLKGQLPIGLIVLKDGVVDDAHIVQEEVAALVRTQIGAVACYKESIVVKRLPKTRSGKILRKTLRQMIAGETYTVPSTIEDPAALDEIKQTLQEHGAL